MCAMGRALLARPRLLLLDEPSMGLAPVLVERIFEVIVEINKQGTTVLLVEQNALMALEIANRGYVLGTAPGRAGRHGRGAARQRGRAQDVPRRGLSPTRPSRGGSRRRRAPSAARRAWRRSRPRARGARRSRAGRRRARRSPGRGARSARPAARCRGAGRAPARSRLAGARLPTGDRPPGRRNRPGRADRATHAPRARARARARRAGSPEPSRTFSSAVANGTRPGSWPTQPT